MESVSIPLSQLAIGSIGKVSAIEYNSANFRRFLNLGIIKDTVIESYEKSPSGDPTAYFIRGAIIALRGDEADHVIVSTVS